MKKRIVSITLALIIVTAMAGTSMAWQSYIAEKSVSQLNMETVKVEVIENGFTYINGAEESTYKKNMEVRSSGTGKTYVRVRLIPQWSEASLPVSNINLNLSGNSNWTKKQSDGYYYFKYYLRKDQVTSSLLEGITIKDLDSDYDKAQFTLKIVAEGVQINQDALEAVWGLTKLPFNPEEAWIP